MGVGMDDFGKRVWMAAQDQYGNSIGPTIQDFFERRITDEELLPRLQRMRSLTEESLRKADLNVVPESSDSGMEGVPV